jgi:tetratricopeptide (TPR) repeat protein
MDGQVKDRVLDDPAKLRELIERAKTDPLELVRKLAPRFSVARSVRLCAQRQYAQAVEVCRQAIQTNPKDDLSYNLLAWIKATCADPSVRDGQEAVAAATKSCQLTAWKEWDWIDTLAAAYAEAGNFKRAIHFAERALRTGHPAEWMHTDIRRIGGKRGDKVGYEYFRNRMG